jgi:hypothetical protein
MNRVIGHFAQMLWVVGWLLVIVVLVLCACLPALAQSQCGLRAAVIEHLAVKFGETRRSVGLAANSTVMETFASDATGTWTITVTTPQGMTCLIASGQAFEVVVESLPRKGTPG